MSRYDTPLLHHIKYKHKIVCFFFAIFIVEKRTSYIGGGKICNNTCMFGTTANWTLNLLSLHNYKLFVLIIMITNLKTNLLVMTTSTFF